MTGFKERIEQEIARQQQEKEAAELKARQEEEAQAAERETKIAQERAAREAKRVRIEEIFQEIGAIQLLEQLRDEVWEGNGKVYSKSTNSNLQLALPIDHQIGIAADELVLLEYAVEGLYDGGGRKDARYLAYCFGIGISYPRETVYSSTPGVSYQPISSPPRTYTSIVKSSEEKFEVELIDFDYSLNFNASIGPNDINYKAERQARKTVGVYGKDYNPAEIQQALIEGIVDLEAIRMGGAYRPSEIENRLRNLGKGGWSNIKHNVTFSNFQERWGHLRTWTPSNYEG